MAARAQLPPCLICCFLIALVRVARGVIWRAKRAHSKRTNCSEVFSVLGVGANKSATNWSVMRVTQSSNRSLILERAHRRGGAVNYRLGI